MVESSKAHLKFTPADSININLTSNETARSMVTIENTGASPIAFKVKTTQPKRYLVKPNQGVLPPGNSEKIQIQVVPKERQQLLSEGNVPSGSSSHDRFLVQCVVCQDSLLYIDKDSPELSEKLADLWRGGEKADVQQAKFSVTFTSPTDASATSTAGTRSSGGSGDRLREMIATAEKTSAGTSTTRTGSNSGISGSGGAGSTTTSGTKGGSPLTSGSQSFQSEVLNMRKKYDDLVSYTVNLTAERDKLKNELEQTKKDLNKAVVARLSAEKSGEGGGTAAKDSKSRRGASAEDGFSLIQLLVVAIVCTLIGRYLHS